MRRRHFITVPSNKSVSIYRPSESVPIKGKHRAADPAHFSVGFQVANRIKESLVGSLDLHSVFLSIQALGDLWTSSDPTQPLLVYVK